MTYNNNKCYNTGNSNYRPSYFTGTEVAIGAMLGVLGGVLVSEWSKGGSGGHKESHGHGGHGKFIDSDL